MPLCMGETHRLVINDEVISRHTKYGRLAYRVVATEKFNSDY